MAKGCREPRHLAEAVKQMSGQTAVLLHQLKARFSVEKSSREETALPLSFTFLSLSYSMSSGLCLWIKALKARPSFQLQERRGE